MKRKVYDFDWDDANTKKCVKHGVSVSEIEFLFDNNPTIFFDSKHSKQEVRYLAIGKTKNYRSILCAFTHRIKNDYERIRPISARYMHRKEVEYYKKYEK